MTWNRFVSSKQRLRGRAMVWWGRFTDDRLGVLAGRRLQLVERVREQYGLGRVEAEQQVDGLARSFAGEDFGPRT